MIVSGIMMHIKTSRFRETSFLSGFSVNHVLKNSNQYKTQFSGSIWCCVFVLLVLRLAMANKYSKDSCSFIRILSITGLAILGGNAFVKHCFSSFISNPLDVNLKVYLNKAGTKYV